MSIAGIRLGENESSVRSKLGPPPHIQPLPGSKTVYRWDYPTRRMSIMIGHRKVTLVFITTVPGKPQRIDRTSKGIGLLSPMSAVLKAYPGNCNWYPPSPPGCGWRSGRTEMTFQVSGRYGMGLKAPLETIQLTYISP